MKIFSKNTAFMKNIMVHIFSKNKNRNKLWQWIKFSLVGSVVPIALSIGYDRWLGYNFSLSDVEYLSDFALVTVSLAAGILSGLDEENKHTVFTLPLFGELPIVSVILGLIVYSFTFKRKSEVFDGEITRIIFIVAILIYLVNLFLGIMAERKKIGDEDGADGKET